MKIKTILLLIEFLRRIKYIREKLGLNYNYILPQYIYGYFRENEDGSLELVRNSLKNTHKYCNYYSFDGKLINKQEEIKK